MEIESRSDLLDREKYKEIDILSRISKLLQQFINYGTNVFDICSNEVRKISHKQDSHIAILLIFMHILEMLDGIDLQLRCSQTVSANLQLRTIFESLISLNWIFQKDTTDRACAYMIRDILDQIKVCDAFDATTPEGKELIAKISKDQIASGKDYQKIDIQVLEKKRSELKSLLDSELYRDVHNLFVNKGISSKWYFIHGGGTSLEQLASKVGKDYQYWLLYREWSRISHGSSQVRNKVLEGGYLKGMRDPANIQTIAQFATSFSLEAIQAMLTFYNPEELQKFKTWYINNWRDENLWLNTLKVNINYL